jgi:hypothetical protein
LSNDNKGNTFPTRHAPSNADAHLRSGNVTKDDHGKKFMSEDNEFFEASARENKTKATAAAMMEAQH